MGEELSRAQKLDDPSPRNEFEYFTNMLEDKTRWQIDFENQLPNDLENNTPRNLTPREMRGSEQKFEFRPFSLDLDAPIDDMTKQHLVRNQIFSKNSNGVTQSTQIYDDVNTTYHMAKRSEHFGYNWHQNKNSIKRLKNSDRKRKNISEQDQDKENLKSLQTDRNLSISAKPL